MDTLSKDIRLVCLASMAWLHEHDTGSQAELLNENIDPHELAAAIDRLTPVIKWLKEHVIFK